MNQPAHSLLGASAAARWLNCPGSFALSQAAPRRRPSIYAATGTVAHRLIEASVTTVPRRASTGMITGGKPPHLPRVDPRLSASSVNVEGYDIEIDDSLISGVNECIEYVERRIKEIWDPNGTIMLCEERVNLDGYFTGRPPPVSVFGTLDIMLATTRAVEIIDYKNGAGVLVKANDNPQFLFYAAGALRKFPLVISNNVMKLTVVQPHAAGQAAIRSQDLDPLDIRMWVDDVLVPGVQACEEPNAPLEPGAWCRFCPARHVCPALHKAAQSTAKREFTDTVLPTDPEDLAEQLILAERAEIWMSAIRGFAQEQIKAGVEVPGWDVVPTRPTRRWTDANEVYDRLRGTGIGTSNYMNSSMKSPAQMDKLLKHQPVAVREWYAREITPLIERKSSGEKLARVKTVADWDPLTDDEIP